MPELSDRHTYRRSDVYLNYHYTHQLSVLCSSTKRTSSFH
jgi:hypothetical protein